MITSQLQTGAFTISTDDKVKDVTITAVTLARTMVQYSVKHDNGTRMNKWGFRFELTSTTNLRFTREENAYDGGVTIEWVVTEFASGVATVQTGIVNPSANPTNITISAVTLSRSFPILFASTTLAEGRSILTSCGAALTSTTNLRLQWATAATPSIDTLKTTWQVVEFASGVAVQSGAKVYSHADGSATQTITSVTTSKTLILNFSYGDAGSNLLSRTSVRSTLTNATTITFSNSETGGTANDLTNNWYAVEFTDGTSVQSGLQTIAATAASANVTISAVVLARSQPWISWSWQNFKTAETTDEGNALCTFKLTTTTNLNIARTLTATGVDVSWFVVQWEASGIPMTLMEEIEEEY